MEQKSDFDIAKRIGIIDIESTSLEAQHGYMLCACIKEVNRDNLAGKITTFSITDPRNKHGLFNDRWVVEQTIAESNKYDLLIGWYSSRFDFPFINTRALHHKLMPPKKDYRRDLCFNSRGSLKLKNNRLATVGEFLFGESGKSFLKWATWVKAQQGDRKSIEYIVDHCKKDVVETERVYKRMTPLFGKLRRR
jgi:uncharacterized protein YprB with RNaseH-like and TPR domain